MLSLSVGTASAQPNAEINQTLFTSQNSALFDSFRRQQYLIRSNFFPNLIGTRIKSIWLHTPSTLPTTIPLNNVSIRLGTTASTTQGMTFRAVPFLAREARTVGATVMGPSWIEIPLDNSFPVDNGLNILLEIEINTHLPGIFFTTLNAAGLITTRHSGSNAHPNYTRATSGSTSNVIPLLGFTVEPSKPTLTLSGPTTFCNPGSVTLSGPSLPHTATGYLWSNGATTRDITVSASGSYSLRIISPCCTSEASDPVVVTVNPIPARPLIYGLEQDIDAVANNANPVQLFTDAGVPVLWSTGLVAETLTVTAPGTYSARVIANGCTSAVSNVVNVTTPPKKVVWNGTGNFDTDLQNWSSGSIPNFQLSDTLVVASGTLNLNVSQYLQVKHLIVNAGANLKIGSYNFMVQNSITNNGTIYGTSAGLALNVGITSINGTGSIELPSVSIGEDLNALILENKIKTGAFYCQVPVNVMHPNAEIIIVADEAKLLDGMWSTSRTTGPIVFGANNEQKLKVERHWNASLFNTNGAWLNIGPPFRNYAVGSLADGNPFATSTYDNSVPNNSSLFGYDPTNNVWPANNGFVKFSAPTSKLATGQGVRLWVTKAKADQGYMTFAGNPYTLPLTIPLKYCPGGCTYTGANANGYNLVGNPLIAGLSWTEIRKVGITDAYWVWRNNIGQYASYAGGVGVNGADGVIGTGQAFWVEAQTSSSSLGVDGFSLSPGNRLMRSQPVESLVRLQVLTSGKVADEVAVRLDALATSGLDNGLDARKFMQQNGGISTVQPDGVRMAINSIPDQAAIVPITISSALVGQQLRIKLENYTSTLPVWLTHASLTAPIRITDTLTLTIQPDWVSDLSLKFGSSVTNLENDLKAFATVLPNPTQDKVEVQLTSGSLKNIMVLDATGRIVKSTPATGHSTLVSLESLPSGIYHLVINTNTSNTLRKTVTKY